MKLIRQKLYSEFNPLPYKTKLSRLGDAASGFLAGAAIGVIPGGFLGLLLGGSKGLKYGSILGASLVAPIISKLAYEDGSKSSIDKQNKERKKAFELEQQIKKNPLLLYKKIYGDKIKLISDYKTLEKKIDIKFPDQFYKLIDIQDRFMRSNYIKFYKEREKLTEGLIPGTYRLYEESSFIYSVPPVWVTENSIKNDGPYDDNDRVAYLLYDPCQADDTYITWNIDKNTFGTDVCGENDKKTFKEALLEQLKNEEISMEDFRNSSLNFIDTDLCINLIKKYQQEIKNKL